LEDLTKIADSASVHWLIIKAAGLIVWPSAFKNVEYDWQTLKVQLHHLYLHVICEESVTVWCKSSLHDLLHAFPPALQSAQIGQAWVMIQLKYKLIACQTVQIDDEEDLTV
jgi:hypothetical protein